MFSDEIYDQIQYDDAVHVAIASLAPDVLCVTFNGLSKAYRVAGFRAGWTVVSGPTQHGIQAALGGSRDIREFVLRFLREEHVMLVQGTGFNWPRPDHLRIVTLPHAEDLADAVGWLAEFLDRWS